MINSYSPGGWFLSDWRLTFPKTIMSDIRASSESCNPAAWRPLLGTQEGATGPEAQRTYRPQSHVQTGLFSAFSSFSDLINMCWLPLLHQTLYQVLEMSDKLPSSKVLPAQRGVHTSRRGCLQSIHRWAARHLDSGLRNHRFKPPLCYWWTMGPQQVKWLLCTSVSFTCRAWHGVSPQ